MIRLLLNLLIVVLQFAIMADVLLSWFLPNKNNAFLSILRNITSPLYVPGKRLMEKFSSDLPFDFSPVIAYFLLDLVRRFI